MAREAMTPTAYEKAVLERFRTYWPVPRFLVKHNIRLRGTKTKSRGRQIDIGVFKAGKATPFLIGEAKMHARRIDAVRAGSTIALVQDVGRIPTVLVATSGFSIAAENHLASEGIECLIITLKEARGLRWISFVEERFVPDGEFRELSGHLVEALRNGDVDFFINAELPYEEWLAVVGCGQSLFGQPTVKMLRTIAEEHFDDGVRFNAIVLLEESGQLSRADIERLLSRELDPDNLELLQGL